jgi:hypothetical protein
MLLPERRFFRGQSMSRAFLGKSRRFQHCNNADSGETAQLQRYFQCIPDTWPMAAISREHEFADCLSQCWLRADPLYLQVEMRGARVMACGNLNIDLAQKNALCTALKPVFADYGYELLLSQQEFFYLRVLHASAIPHVQPATDILGCDLAGILPQNKSWLALFNECQIMLHNHQLNVERQRQGLLPINALWFWGQGKLPTVIYHHLENIKSDDFDLKALHSIALPHVASQRNTLIDMRASREWLLVEQQFDSSYETVFDFADGTQWHWKPEMKWFFWRRKKSDFT